jgi:CBS domain containing-hemolysin-like protein
MNEHLTAAEPAQASGDTDEDSPSSASSEPPRRSGERPRPSLWMRIVRSARGRNGSNLRENFTDALLTDAENGTAFSPEERAMLHNILRLREVRVEDVMVPRADIEAVDQSISLAELLVLFEESGRSRMPIYNDNLDDPRGMVHIRDLLGYLTKQARSRRRAKPSAASTAEGAPATPPPSNARNGKAPMGLDLSRIDLSKTVQDASIVRKVLFVPPSMLASDLMKRMQATRTQMALVIDEYGGTDGLVSLEDIVEMVVGDIEDEHDDTEQMITRSAEDVFVIDARAELEDIAAAIGADFDVREQVEEVDTLGGLLFSELGRIPARGEVVQALPGFEFQVLDADPRRIKRVRVIRKRQPERRRRTLKDSTSNDMPARTDLPAAE